MNFYPGDFVQTSRSSKAALIINHHEDNYSLLISIHEYNGDYAIVSPNEINKVNLTPEEKLSIVSNFGSWFYDTHKHLYQEIILQNIFN